MDLSMRKVFKQLLILYHNKIISFAGGTNFGFLNGANTVSRGTDNSGLQPTTTSYDYDSPISECGNLTEKYYLIRDIIQNHTTVNTKVPKVPDVKLPVKYSELELQGGMSFHHLIEQAKQKIESRDLIPMEKLPINNDAGQSYGYIVYRKTGLSIAENSTLRIMGYVRDTVMVLLNGRLISNIPKNATDICKFGFWTTEDSHLNLPVSAMKNATLDLIVENMGRVNYGRITSFVQFKGLENYVYLNDEKLSDWVIVPFEFKKSFNKNLKDLIITDKISPPAIYSFELILDNNPEDTFVDMRNWTKGITIVNGFVLGRHFFVGPQQSLFLPASFLKKGANYIQVFEHYKAPKSLKFSEIPLFVTPMDFTNGCRVPLNAVERVTSNAKCIFGILGMILTTVKYLT